MTARVVLFVLLAAFAAAQEQVSIRTVDGDELLGEVSVKALTLETDFGSAEVRVDQIASITFGDPDVLTTRGETTLVGEVTLKSLRLTTADGRRTLKRAELASWVAVVDGKRLDATDFSGPWMTSYGPMQLEQAGRDVTGHYGFDETPLSGTVEGDTLTMAYKGDGEVVFKLWADDLHFSGSWSKGSDDGKWAGYRHRPLAPEPKPGEVVQGQTEAGMLYHLRVPKDYDGKKSYPAIAFFHGSNMSSSSYVYTIASAWPQLAEDYVLVGFDGERMNAWSKEGEPTYNFTYVNFGGHGVGPAWAHRQSPALVAEGLDEVREQLALSKWFLGGHSQGGFLTYAMVMFYPEKIAGAFPMSCNLLVQCEPGNFDDEGVRAAQRAVAMAPIHGENDNVVAFSGGEYCHAKFVDGGFPTLHFFTHPSAGHMFALLPVEAAVRWLEAMTSDDAETVAAAAEAAVEEERWRDATAALARVAALADASAVAGRVSAVRAAVDKAAVPTLRKLLPAAIENKNGDWIEDFLAFRVQFADAPAAEDLMAAYAQLRKEHEEPADALFWKQRGEEDEDKRDEMRREIVEKYYASSWYELVKGWLDE